MPILSQPIPWITRIISSIPNLSLNTLQVNLSVKSCRREVHVGSSSTIHNQRVTVTFTTWLSPLTLAWLVATMDNICTRFGVDSLANFLLQHGLTHSHRHKWSSYLHIKLPPAWSNNPSNSQCTKLLHIIYYMAKMWYNIYQKIYYLPCSSHTHNRFTAVLEYVRDHPGEQVPER